MTNSKHDIRALIEDAKHHFAKIGVSIPDREAAAYVAEFVASDPFIHPHEKLGLVKAAKDVLATA